MYLYIKVTTDYQTLEYIYGGGGGMCANMN